jgi:bacterioferritin
MNPATLKERAITEYVEPDDPSDLQGMIRENLLGERVVIEVYTEIVHWLGDGDITSRRMMESLLKDEEDHADELNDLYEG